MRPHRQVGAVLAGVLLGGCASLPRLPAPEVAARAAAARRYSATLRVSLRGPELRARTRALVAFERPDKLRIEIPGPGGARFVALARGDSLVAVFPAERAVFESGATASELERLIGVALAPAELMDLLLGGRPRGARALRVRWGARLPAQIDATLADGARLSLRVEAALIDAELPVQAFAPLAAPGYRLVDSEEARQLWSR